MVLSIVVLVRLAIVLAVVLLQLVLLLGALVFSLRSVVIILAGRRVELVLMA